MSGRPDGTVLQSLGPVWTLNGRLLRNWLMGQILRKHLTVRGFIIFDDFGHLYPDFGKEMGAWVQNGKIRYREESIDGLEQAPEAFVGLLNGENLGKRVIRVGLN